MGGKGGKGKDGKGGKGKGGKGEQTGLIPDIDITNIFGRSFNSVELERHGKGKEGKGGIGKGKDSTGSSLLETLSNNLLGQIIQAVLSLLTGAVDSLNPFRTIMEPKAGDSPLPNPLTDPLGFIQHPLISAILQAIVAGDINA